MAREVFKVGTPPEVLSAWIAEAQAARYVGEIELPIVRRPKAEPPPPMDSLFDRLPVQRKGERQRPAPPPPGTPLHVVVSGIFEGALSPPSPLAVKRRERREERAAVAKAEAREAKAAAREAKAAAKAKAEEAPSTEPDAMERLVASGISNEYLAGLGALQDPDAPYKPRSIAFPVTLNRVGGRFQPQTSPRIWELHLSTPACADLPFVRKVEEVTGLKAQWISGALGQWHHAVDLATDVDWERLASSMEHTEEHMVDRAVGMHVVNGSLTVGNASRLLMAVGVQEPEHRVCPNLKPNPDGSLVTSLGGWEAVYAVEDRLIVPGIPKRNTYARVTDAGWRSVGNVPPTPDELKAARKAARC
ncbi:hypothetical protein MMSR116_15780 [Methylobacterium mesophilicum SR1.6/6]|uniref:Uncharacterized protein n=1 Tax=Methylobacterium mesophilicum SR1.6/6 TaxID=908290 RepID=A0A6B9FKQ0_9HYPH|nr:hypothetical protein [Methylobacterium mesophilicum]QGY03181.1 hypothetical protein MMSR116_15780 [Methylobacterium mesophilicum SR1.6/6]